MFRFAPFEVDFSTSELRNNGVRVRIQEQPLRILECLLERPGELVTREDLRDRLWASDTFVDFERSLNAAVAKLRQSLNDSAEHPHYIETVARKGYRFIAPVTAPALPESPVAVPPPQAGWRVMRPFLLAGVLAVGLAVSWVLVWRLSRPEPGRPMLRLDLDVGREVSQPAISSDGMRLVFVTNRQLATHRLDGTNRTALAGTEGASMPFFSPDGRWVGFFADGKLKKISIEGGAPLTLCEAQLGGGGSWGNDDHIIAALDYRRGLSRIPASGGVPQLLANSKSQASARSPQILPGGKGVLFVAGPGPAEGWLQVLPANGGAARTLMKNSSGGRYLAGGHLVYVQRQTLFAAPMDLDRLELTGPPSPLIEGVAHDHFRGGEFDVSSSGTLVYRRSPAAAPRSVVWIDSAGRKETIVEEPGAYLTPRLSPDGKKLALSRDGENQRNLWIFDFGQRSLKRLTSDVESRCCPVWTPESDYVAFHSGGVLGWVRADGGGKVERLASSRGEAVPWTFSPDGKWLAFHKFEPNVGFDPWVAPVRRVVGALQIGEPRRLFRQAGIQAAPAISPDGRWFAYGSDESGRVELYVAPFSPDGPTREEKWQVSERGAMSPTWSPNGRELFFRSLDRRVFTVAYTARGDSFVAQKPRAWSTHRLSDVGAFPAFDVAADGKRIVAIVDTEESMPDETHLRVVVNAADELRRRAALR